MGLMDYKLAYVPKRPEIVAGCSDKAAEGLIEAVKVQCDADPQFAKGFKAFIKAGPEKRKQIYTADLRKSETWSNDIVDHQDAIALNDGNVRDAKAEKTRLTTEHDATIARLTSEYEANMATQNTAIVRWNEDTKQQAKEIEAKAQGSALLAPSLKIMDTINNNPPYFVAGLSGMETAGELLNMTTEDSVKEAVDEPQPDGEDSSGTKILITLAALGVNKHEIHGEDGIDINPKRVRRMGKATQVRLICECLCIGDTVGGLFSTDIEMKIRRDQSQDRKRTLEEDPDSPLNKFHKRIKVAAATSPYKDRIDDAAADKADEDATGAGTKPDDSQE